VSGLDGSVDSASWWESVCDQLDTPIADLVDGFDEIAETAIPYDWLPGRARTFYGDAFTTWSDLAGETIDSLVHRPKGGVGTVRSIVIAARDVVSHSRSAAAAHSPAADAPTATRLLLDRLTDYDRVVLLGRRWALEPAPIVGLADQLGVHAASVGRNFPRAVARFESLLADPFHVAVVRHADDLRHRLGPLTRTSTAEAALDDLGLALSDDRGLMLLHLAGPYTPAEAAWLQDTAAEGWLAATAAVEATLAQWGAPSTAALADSLAELGIPSATAVDFIHSRPGLRRFDQKWVQWGSTIPDRIEAVLHLSGAPATATLIAAVIGENCAEASTRSALSYDSRFVRATRHTWALRQWGLVEYGGVFSEIAARIDAAGGTIGTAAVVNDICTRFPDVAESSVRAYMGAPAYVVENQTVRRRTADDGWPPVGPAVSVRGVFYKGRHVIRVALPVTAELLRGSGQPLHSAVATAVGLTPGVQRIFTGKACSITAFWKLSSITGGSLGSLRAAATGVGAQLGDTLVLSFNVADSTLAAVRIQVNASPEQRVKGLLGTLGRDPLVDIARALRCGPDDAAGVLIKRGDDDLLDLLDEIWP
jgi:hypothetical protein